MERLLVLIETIDLQVKDAEKQIRQLVKGNEICLRLMTVPGVGPITAMRFVATLDDIKRFSTAHDVQSYLGLTPGAQVTLKDRSLVVFDVKGELEAQTARARRKFGDVKIIRPYGGGSDGFNPLARPDAETDLSVIANTTLDAFERVWGDEDTHAKPTIRRVLKATFPEYENYARRTPRLIPVRWRA